MKTISVKTGKREEMLDISGEVRQALREYSETTPSAEAAATPPFEGGELLSGVVVLFVQHTTCGLTVNENADPDVKRDMLGWLRRLVPQFPPAGRSALEDSGSPPFEEGVPGGPEKSFFKHYEHNSDAHIKASLMGPSLTVPFAGGELLLGRWQGIYLCEFDGPRERKVVVKVLT